MADANFNRKSVKELQKYLKERSVTFSDLWKAELVEICEAADRLGIDVDPDGLLEDREDILREKLLIPEKAFGLFEDGYVLDIECCSLGGHYSSVKSNVRPRTNDKDPVSKLKYYKAWIVFSKSDKGCFCLLFL
jgi:hypothetical protein